MAALDHDEAMRWQGDWSTVDVVVVDAADEGRAGDQFPGVAVVRQVRNAAASSQPMVVVVTGHYMHDGLRHRMRAAGADFFYLRSDLRTPEALVDVVLHPERHRRGVPVAADPDAPGRLGVSDGSNVEAFVSWIDEEELGPELAGAGSRGQPRSRRWSRVRREAAGAGHIEPVNLTTGDRPRDQSTPSIRQLARLWAWAARVRKPDS